MTTAADPTHIPALIPRDIGHYEQRGLVSLSLISEVLQHLRAAIAAGDRARADELAAAAGWYAEEHLLFALEGSGAIADGVRASAHNGALEVLAVLGPVEPLEESREGRHTGPIPVVRAAAR